MPRSKRPMTVSPEEFAAWIQEALAELPARFATLADEVSIVVEEEPPADVLQDLELESEDDLLGLYQGVPIISHLFSSLLVSCPPVSPSIEAPSCVSAGRRRK